MLFSLNSRVRKEKKWSYPRRSRILVSFFFIIEDTTSTTIASLTLSLSLSFDDHYKKKKSNGYIYHTLGHCRKTAIFILLLLYIYIFFIPRTATIAIIQMPLLHLCSQCAFVPAHYCFSDAILLKRYCINVIYILYIFYKRTAKNSFTRTRERRSFCRLNIICYYIISYVQIRSNFSVLKF